jgi:prevent-host-death family protein
MDEADLTITASEFKAKCLELLDQLGSRKLKRMVVTKRGRPVAVLTPPRGERETAEGLYGCMQGSVIVPEGFDLTAPVLDEALHADRGRLHE